MLPAFPARRANFHCLSPSARPGFRRWSATSAMPGTYLWSWISGGAGPCTLTVDILCSVDLRRGVRFFTAAIPVRRSERRRHFGATETRPYCFVRFWLNDCSVDRGNSLLTSPVRSRRWRKTTQRQISPASENPLLDHFRRDLFCDYATWLLRGNLELRENAAGDRRVSTLNDVMRLCRSLSPVFGGITRHAALVELVRHVCFPSGIDFVYQADRTIATTTCCAENTRALPGCHGIRPPVLTIETIRRPAESAPDFRLDRQTHD